MGVTNIRPAGVCGVVFIVLRNVTQWKANGSNPFSHLGLFGSALSHPEIEVL